MANPRWNVPILDRVKEKIELITETGCWIWMGSLRDGGYGRISVRGKGVPVHRLIYELLVGPIPKGLHLDHLCRVHSCVNPAHLEPVTCRENLLRGIGPTAIHAKKTHCIHGHPYDEENTARWQGMRYCKTCKRIWQRNFRRSQT